MNLNDLLQPAIYLLSLLILAPLLGRFMHRQLQRPASGPHWTDRLTVLMIGRQGTTSMGWKAYLGAVLVFNAAGLLAVLALLLFQSRLPWNPAALPDVPFPLAWNTAVSFVTNTNWQAYSGESTLSPLSQMAGLAVQNFVSAATGIGVLLALARGLASRQGEALGNFWQDLVRSTLFVLLPLAAVLAMVLVSQGVVQTMDATTSAVTLEGQEQVIPLGPAASQIAIKQLGTNGGGFFGVNGAHPFENPTPLSNFLQMLSILLLPAACVFLFAEMIGSRRHGWVIFGTMLALLIGGFTVACVAEFQPNASLGVSRMLEGKETRLGIVNSVLWSSTTTAASNGSVNAMHDSLTPLAGGMALFNIMLGEVVFGGVGAGLYGMLMFVILTVFMAGLMVGRSPEYLGKKIELREVAWSAVAVLLPCAVILIGAAVSSQVPAGLAGVSNAGPHGLTGLLYNWSSAAGNNGSAFGSMSVNTPFYNYAFSGSGGECGCGQPFPRKHRSVADLRGDGQRQRSHGGYSAFRPGPRRADGRGERRAGHGKTLSSLQQQRRNGSHSHFAGGQRNVTEAPSWNPGHHCQSDG
jgi:potassium-transporting ATPase potassium-binding subunit